MGIPLFLVFVFLFGLTFGTPIGHGVHSERKDIGAPQLANLLVDVDDNIVQDYYDCEDDPITDPPAPKIETTEAYECEDDPITEPPATEPAEDCEAVLPVTEAPTRAPT